jgi:putative protease
MEDQLPELLAPVGSREALIASVNAGADAVYLGGKRFGARKYAVNFTDEELGTAIDYAHLRGVKVYVTVNILVHDRELPEVARYLVFLYRCGADGVLVQDLGVAAIALQVVPRLPLHASTQCTITDAGGVIWAHHFGFSRVVLARELGIEEIDRIFTIPASNRPGIELFVHGALCYAYSGRCLLSSVIGRRSGNRGMCAQPCRKPYRLVRGKADKYGRIQNSEVLPLPDSYLLSTRDLCIYPRLSDIIWRRPVTAFKIEGRMRSPEYVAIVVSRYRKAIDALAKGMFSPREEDIEDMAVAFSRGFSSGYLFGDRGPAILGRRRSDNQGLFIGTVQVCRTGEMLVIPAARTIPGPGDGLVAINPLTKEERGFVLQSGAERRGNYLVICHNLYCQSGLEVYLTRSSRLEREAAAIMKASGPLEKFPLDIDITLLIHPGKSPVLIGSLMISDGRTLVVRHEGAFVPESAKRRSTTGEEITHQIRKTGASVFRVREFVLDYPGGLFLPVGQLNSFRREFLSIAECAILAALRPSQDELHDAEERLAEFDGAFNNCLTCLELTIPILAVLCDEPLSAGISLAAGCDRVYLEPDGDPITTQNAIRSVLDTGQGYRGRTFWKWPSIPSPGFIESALPLLHDFFKAGLAGVMAETPSVAAAIKKELPDIEITGGSGLNIFNYLAVQAYSPLFSGFTLSPELSGKEITELVNRAANVCPGSRIAVLVEGNLEAMVTADSLLDMIPAELREDQQRFGLLDGTDRTFPIHIDSAGRSHIFNAAELCLLDHLPELAASGVNMILIDARYRGPEYARDMVALYREALGADDWISGRSRAEDVPGQLKPRIKEMARGGITTGHYSMGCVDK